MLERAGLAPPAGFAAAHFQPAADIVSADLVLVFDKFTAADVLREVSVMYALHWFAQAGLVLGCDNCTAAGMLREMSMLCPASACRSFT